MNIIPFYDNHSNINPQRVHQNFYNYSGCMILKNVFEKRTMRRYNRWCHEHIQEVMKDQNCRHPKQKDKILINDVMGRMSLDNPELLTMLIGNKTLNQYVDALLGLGKIGACTCHWLEPHGKRQLSHVDYPIHIGSGDFWENSVDKMRSITTSYQLNHMLPYYSIQVLIASDKMDEMNGSTEVVPGSHNIEDLDIKLHNPEFYSSMEQKFVNTRLEQGDVFIFSRRLCHRGGENISSERRNSLIIQYVWPWGVGQEIIDPEVNERIKKTYQYGFLDTQDQSRLQLRVSFPYPKIVSHST